mgnify:CR=1 FL=1
MIYHPAPKIQYILPVRHRNFSILAIKNVAIESEMVENVGVAVRISLIFHAVLTTQGTSGLLITVLTSGSPVISNNARNIVIELEMVENVGIVVCISLISHYVP